MVFPITSVLCQGAQTRNLKHPFLLLDQHDVWDILFTYIQRSLYYMYMHKSWSLLEDVKTDLVGGQSHELFRTVVPDGGNSQYPANVVIL